MARSSAASTSRRPPPYTDPQPGHAYIAGIDWGRSQDYTAIAVIDAANGKMVALDRFKNASWNLQRKRLANIVAHWRPQIVWAEANAIGEPNIEALNQAGLPIRPFYTTAKSKAPLIEALALAIERNEITLLDDPALLAEFSAYSLHRLPNGGYRYSAPPGAPRRHRHRHRPRLVRQQPHRPAHLLRLMTHPLYTPMRTGAPLARPQNHPIRRPPIHKPCRSASWLAHAYIPTSPHVSSPSPPVMPAIEMAGTGGRGCEGPPSVPQCPCGKNPSCPSCLCALRGNSPRCTRRPLRFNRSTSLGSPSPPVGEGAGG